MTAAGLLIRDVELAGGRRADVRIASGLITELGELKPLTAEVVLDGCGGALSAGLADHHLHLLAMAAAAESLDLRPSIAPDLPAVTTALATAAPDGGGWIRAVGYAEQAGPLELALLDRLQPVTPLRVQHRSGALWMLNSAALSELGLRDLPEGRLWRGDNRLAERMSGPPPDLARLGRELAGYGITAVTDATADLPARSQSLLAAAVTDGRLPQQVLLLGAQAQTGLPAKMTIGPFKIVLGDHELPGYDTFRDQIRAARSARRAVAVHCVTRAALALTIAALDDVGPHPHDRIEHGSLIAPAALRELRRLGVTVVSQPGFLADRGDDYRRDLPADDLADLYRFASLDAAGVPVACSSDAPFGPADPWAVLRAAADRRAPDGVVLGEGERVPPGRALRGYLAAPLDPGGPPRTVSVGAAADLVLLHQPWAAALAEPHRDLVRCTIYAGRIFE